MPNQEFEDSCSDMTEEYTLKIPCVLAARAKAYAKEKDTEITNVVIEALDHFLRING